MNTQSSFDRTLLVPIGVGVFSLLGMCAILVAGRMNALRATVEEVPTATAFQYALIGTEPAVLTVTTDGSEDEMEEFPTFAPEVPTSPLTTPIILSTNTIAPLVTLPPLASTNTPTLTPTSASAPPFGAGTFEDVDSRFVYSGDWDVTAALHVSYNLGNSVSFRFIGQELRLFFQSGPSLGTIRLTLDNSTYDLNQSTAEDDEWVLPSVTNGTHRVTITHLSGGSINLDYIIIPVVPPTAAPPTITNTPLNQ